MFCAHFFAPRFFPARFFPEVGGVSAFNPFWAANANKTIGLLVEPE